MRYRPFLVSEHPKLFAVLGEANYDLSVMRRFKNPRYLDNNLRFAVVFSDKVEEKEFSLNEETLDLSACTKNEMDGLAYICKSLAEADEIDMRLAHTPMTTQFAVMNSFRTIHPGYGGKRYVAICRDIIDANMGSSLHPYMYGDLVSAAFLNFNKSTGKDADGLLEGILEFLEDINLDEEELRGFYSLVGNKCNPMVYNKFAMDVLRSPKLSASMRHMIVASMSLVRFNSKELAPQLPMNVIATFPKDDLALILKNAPSGLKPMIYALFEAFGQEVDESLVNAYMENPYRDMSLISNAPFFPALPPHLKRKILRGRIFTNSSSTTEIINYFASIEDEREKEEIIRACMDMGRNDLGKALSGQDFSLLPFQVHEIRALLPYANLQTPTMVMRLYSYIRHCFDRHQRSEDLDELLLTLKYPDDEILAEEAVMRHAFFSDAKWLYMADKFHLIELLGWKEWKYHD